MALTHTDTDITTLKINSFETLADYQAAYAQGLIDGNELSFIDESLQADWGQTIGTAPDFIKNKPTIPDAVSGTHDGSDWTTITIGSVTKAIPSGSGGTGGSSTLSGLDDTAISSPSDGQVLVYSETVSKWVNGAVQASAQVGTLNTNNSSSLSVNDSESLSGTVSLHKVAKTGKYSDLIGTPTIPTVNDATLTIQKNGSTIGTFTANSSSAKTVNIEVPAAQVNSDWNSTSGVSRILNKPTLATVATSGSYNDLSDTPTIPTVNDATLTIQRNGSTIGTFTANSSAAKTVNIEVPEASNSGILTIQKNSSTIGTFSADDSNSKTVNIEVPAAQVNSDWNSTSGVSRILNKPTLSTVATSGSYNDLSNKPTIPTVNDAALTVKRNGITLVSFSANASSPETVDINVPSVGNLNTNNSSSLSVNSSESLSGTVSLHKISKTGKYSDLSGTPTLADVATSGSYSDLSGTPTIGNALLTISRNSVVLGTFSADATTDKSVNIQVPTTAADVNAMPSNTKYGDSILLSMNGATDTLTATLKDQDGNTLGTSTAVITGRITDITYTAATKSLLISKSDSSTIGLNFQDAPSSTAPNSLLSGLRDDINTNAGAIAVLNGSGSGSVSSTVSSAISNLNAQVTTASKTNDIVSIKSALTESNGIISNTSSGTIDLAKVAATGSSGDVTVSYGGSQQNNVQSAITDLDSRVTSLSGNQIEYILPNSADTTPSGYSHYYSGSSSYTGTLAASASTMNKIYVCRTTQGGDYHQIMTVKNGSSYSWIDMSTQSIDLTGYAKSVTVNGNAYTTSGSGTDINVGNVITAVTGESAVSGGVQDYVSVTATTTSGSGGSRTTSLVSRVKTQAVATAAQNQDGLATANDVRGYVHDNQTIIRTWTVSDIPDE